MKFLTKLFVALFFALLCLSFAEEFSERVNVQRLHSQANNIILDKYFDGNTKVLFKVWHYVFNKDYDYNTEFGINRYKVFKDRVQEIKKHNSGNFSYMKGLNEFSDLNYNEIRQNLGIKTYEAEELNERQDKFLNKISTKVANSINSKKANKLNNIGVENEKGSNSDKDWGQYMESVESQGKCGAGWAIATIGSLEANFNIKNGFSYGKLSSQQVLDCDKFSYGCKGGSIENALNYLKGKYSTKTSLYPYTGKTGICKYVYALTTWVRLDYYEFADNKDDVINLLGKGALVVGVYVADDWFDYRSGVYNSSSCYGNNSHFVTLVALKSNSVSQEYITIKNSWGASWGNFGYMNIATENGACNALNYAYFPQAEKYS